MNTHNELLDFYRTHSSFTDPGKFSYLFDNLPTDKAGLRSIIAGIRINFISDQVVLGYKAPFERLHELDSRTMERMLEKILRLCDKDLSYSRPVEQRLAGTCRDAALFMCAMLRHQNIPARMRYGVSPSQMTFTNILVDHSICEYWDETSSKWVAIETEITQRHLDTHKNKTNINLNDLKRPFFTHSGVVVSDILNGNGSQYLHSNQGPVFYRNIFLRDIAFLNKQEVNIWDHWGIMLKNPKEASEKTLNLLRELSQGEQSTMEFTLKIKNIYNREKELQVPGQVICKCPNHRSQEIATH